MDITKSSTPPLLRHAHSIDASGHSSGDSSGDASGTSSATPSPIFTTTPDNPPPYIPVKRCRLGQWRKSTTFIIFTVSLATFTDTFVYSVVIPVIPYVFVSRMHLNHHDVQTWVDISLAVYSLALIVASPIFGYYSDRFRNRKYSMLVGLVMLIVSLLISVFTTSVYIYAFTRVLQGISAAVVWTVGLAIVADTAPPGKVGILMSFPSMAVSAGTVTGPIVGGFVYDKLGYTAVCEVALGIITFDIALRLLMVENRAAGQYVERAVEEGLDRPKEPTLLSLLLNPRIINALVQSAVVGWQLTALDATLTIHLTDIFGFRASDVGFMFLPLAIPSVLEPLVGMMCDRVGPRYLVTIGFLLTAPPIMLLCIPQGHSRHDVSLFAVFLTLYGIFSTFVFSPILVDLSGAAQEATGEDPLENQNCYGKVYALFNIAYSAGSLIGPLQAGSVQQRYGWNPAMLSLAIMSGIMVVPSLCLSGGLHPKLCRFLAPARQQQSQLQVPLKPIVPA